MAPTKGAEQIGGWEERYQCFEDMNIKILTKIIRQEEVPLPWAQHFQEVRKNTKTHPPHPHDEESNTTHRPPVHQVIIPVIPFGLGLFISSIVQGRVEGSISGVILHGISCTIPRTLFLRGFLACPFA